MTSFLEALARYVSQTLTGDLADTVILLPNRRAGVFFRRFLARQLPGATWMPEVISVDDYVNGQSRLQRIDALETLFLLHGEYSRLTKEPDPFDVFFHWGEIMLRDFDELDKYLVDADQLFRNLTDLKALEDPLAGLTEEQIPFIRRFWEGFHAGDATREKQSFLETWEQLPRLYHGLRASLLARNQAYPGMQYRELIRDIREGRFGLPPAQRVVVAGFNALNACEKALFGWLKEHDAQFFWDWDREYMEETWQEAGRFMRDNRRDFPEAHALEPFDNLSGTKDIRIFELPSDVMQAKFLHTLLEESGPVPEDDCTHTAVVLCDEELLMPAVLSVPAPADVNITMGYPLRNAPAFGFFDLLLQLRQNGRTDRDGQWTFYYKDVQAALAHPYFPLTGNLDVRGLRRDIVDQNLIRIPVSRFDPEGAHPLFRRVESGMELLHYVEENTSLCLSAFHRLSPGEQNPLDRAGLIHMRLTVQKLSNLLEGRPDPGADLVARLLRKALSSQRLSFEGEPLSGLQIMGILETRLLDFRNVILLSMNEDTMPGRSLPQTYIPHALRRGFGMPSREDRDAIYAYYFKRLLQRARRVDLLYNGSSEGIRSGEPSRYLHQLRFSRRLEVQRPVLNIQSRETLPIRIHSGEGASEKMDLYRSDRPDGKYLSPSAINTYLDCSLKFYFRYVAGIGEPDDVKEELDAVGMGTVVHDAIALLYGELKERKGYLEPADLDRLLASDRPRRVLEECFRDVHFKKRKAGRIEGRNRIILRVMLRYLEKILETDRALGRVDLLALEEEYRRNLILFPGEEERSIRMGGKIDRVDRVGGQVRIIDYKTGKADLQVSSLEDLFDGTLPRRNRAALQTLLYAWLSEEGIPGEGFSPGLYALRHLFQKEYDPLLWIGPGKARVRVLDHREFRDEFMALLTDRLSDLFRPNRPFEQTEQRATCQHCDFVKLCKRDNP